MERLPSWIRIRVPTPTESKGMMEVRALLSRHGLHTVCQAAACPNAVECWSARTATFMLLGEVCTRACCFCAVETGNPGGAMDAGEPDRLAAAVAELGLRYVVLTSVDRDDLPDGGAEGFGAAVRAIREACPQTRIEVLIPDFSGRDECLDAILKARADVNGHNLETIERLSPTLRDPRAGYRQSLSVLAYLAEHGDAPVKSGLMVGLGETDDELRQAFTDLVDAGVEMLTIGQYLRPGPNAVPVDQFVSPDDFERLKEQALSQGFRSVVAGPLVRSSYHAHEAYARSCAS